MSNEQVRTIEEDEIDLRELWQILVKRKVLIILLTSLVTIGAIIWALTRTPIYEVKSNIQIGFIGEGLIAEPETLIKIVNLVFNVEDKISTKDKFVSEISSVTQNKKLKNFIEIKTEAITNEDALAKNKEVVEYIEKMYISKIDQYIYDTNNSIERLKLNIENIKNLETKDLQRQIGLLKTQNIVKIDEEIERLKKQDIINIQRQIGLLKTQNIVKIDEEIERLKKQDIINIQRQIGLLKTQNIVKIDEEINFYKNIKIKSLNDKINFHKEKLNEYTKAVKEIYQNSNKNNDTTISTIASIQMVNYQNLILNSENKIEDLKIEIETITNKTIVNLQRERANIVDVTIKDLQLKIDNINNVTIVNLQRERANIVDVTIKDLQLKIDNINNVTIVNLQRSKANIENDTLRQLNYKLNTELPSKIQNLNNEINKLQYSISEQKIQNSKVIGKYIINDYPIKPKKKLIVVVAFVTGLILSIFIAFFLNFIANSREEK